jgi:WD40 repeat protein
MPVLTHPLQAASLMGHKTFVEGVEFSSNGKYIISSSSGKEISTNIYISALN